MMQWNFTLGVTIKLQGNDNEMLVLFNIPTNFNINKTGKNGQYTQTGNETLKELFRIYFPDSRLSDMIMDRVSRTWAYADTTKQGRQEPGQTCDQSKIRWLLGTFKPFKSAGRDGTVPARLVPHLCHIFRACMAYGFILTAWRQVKVTFILKPGKLDYTKAKAYRPISLSSFLLKTMEKLVDRHIWAGALKIHPLHRTQHAYQIGKSTETAHHDVVTCLENAIEHKDIVLGAFLDIEGAFHRTSLDTIKQAAGRYGIELAICRWICAMLESRNISATLSGETLGGGCGQRVSAGRCAFASASWMILFGDSTVMAITQ
jgi:hypothetical protein